MNFTNQFFSRNNNNNNKLPKGKSTQNFELLPFIKIALSGRKIGTTHVLKKVSNSKSVISDNLDKLLSCGFEGTLDDFNRLYGRKEIIKKIKPKEKLKLDNKLLLKSDTSSKPLKLTKLKEFNFMNKMNKMKKHTSLNDLSNKNNLKIDYSLDKNKNNSRNKSAFDINTKSNTNSKIDSKKILINGYFNKNVIINKINKKYEQLLKLKKIRKILNKKSKEIFKNVVESSMKEKQKNEENDKKEKKEKKVILKKIKKRHFNSVARINKTFKKYLTLKNSDDDPNELKKILDPLDKGIHSDLKEIQKYEGKVKQNIFMKRSTANLVTFGNSFLIMADESFYKDHNRIISKYPSIEREANILVLENKNRGDDKIINKLEKNEKKINHIIRNSDIIMKSIKLKTFNKGNSFVNAFKDKNE